MNKRQRGFTLVELLIGMVIGMVVVAAVTNVLVSSNHMNLDTLRMIRFNQELRSVMNLITSDLRRSGFNGRAVSLIGQPTQSRDFDGITDCGVSALSGDNCVLYKYDDSSTSANNGNGTLESGEQYGFRLNASQVQRSTDAGANWQPLTDTSDLTVDALSFTLTDHEVCESTSNGIHVQSLTISLQAHSTRIPELTRTLTEAVRTRNNRYEYHASANCVGT